MLAFMAGPTLDAGQQAAYLQLFLLPYLLKFLCQAAYPTDPRLWKTTYKVFVWGKSWHWLLRGRQIHSIPKRLRRKKKSSVRIWKEVGNEGKTMLWIYLVPLAVSLFKIGCCIKSSLRLCWLRKIMASCCLRELPSITTLTYATLSNAVDDISAIEFDSDS
jgi:hypothetical protein